MRLISREVDAVLKKPVPVNFGLYFNKFLEYDQEFLPLGKQSPLRQYKSIYCRTTAMVDAGLRDRHHQQSNFCQSAKADGFSVFIFHARLHTPYISGLGMSHPTETGMIFDQTLGVPYIPAAGQKGLLRLAYMLNDLKDDAGNWLPHEQLNQDKDGNPCWEEDNLSRTLFGFSDRKDALGGRLVILDAYPLSQPELAEDILNPHYGVYYGSQGKKCGPTEDQSPVPVKFMVVKKGQEFVFRFILRYGLQKAPSSDIEALSGKIQEAMKTALTEEGFGAKTALGYGRFEIIGEGEEPEIVQQWSQDAKLQRQKREDERLARVELEKYPWRPLLRKIEKIDNWGDFSVQILKNSEAEKYRGAKEFADAVLKAALRTARENPKKWKGNKDRDVKVADWLTPSSITWEPPFSETQSETAPVDSPASDLLQTITALSEWLEYQQAGLKISSLDKSCAEALKKKFIEWGCRQSKNKNKQKAYNQLSKRLKNLK